MSNSRGLAGAATLIFSSGMGSLGNGGRLSISLRAFKVSSVPGATGDPSNAWRAAEISSFGDCILLGTSPFQTQSEEVQPLT